MSSGAKVQDITSPLISGARCGSGSKSESESAMRIRTEQRHCGRSGSGYQWNATSSVRSWRDVPKEQRQKLLLENQLQISTFPQRTTRRNVSGHCKLLVNAVKVGNK